MKKTLTIIAGALLLLGLGCKSPGEMISEKASEKLAEKMIEKAAGGNADIDLEGGTMKVTTKDGSAQWGGTKLPDNWPSDAPVYPGSKVTFSSSNTGTDGKVGAMIVFQSTDNGDKVFEYYKKELPAQGWKVENTMQVEDGGSFTATKDDRVFAVTITYNTKDEPTAMTVILSNK